MTPYTEPIDRRNPTFFLFLIDQSGSMSLPFAGQTGKTKAQGVADAINRIIQELVFGCSLGLEIADRYYMGLMGYNGTINLGFGGPLMGQYHVPVSQVESNPLRVETRVKKTDDGAGGILEQEVAFPIWIDPVACGKTKMREALEIAKESVADFVSSFPESYPPIVMNITDGKPTDATPPDFPEVETAARDLRSISNRHGSHALLYNIHLSSKNALPVLFPTDQEQLPSKYSKLLFRMSSPLTDKMREMASAKVLDVELLPGARGFVYQADLVSVIKCLDIGTRAGANR
jgi:hypothetical protein